MSFSIGGQHTASLLPRRGSAHSTRLSAVPRTSGHKHDEKAVGTLVGGLLGCALVASVPEMLMLAPPAEAGVVMTQPVRKKVFNGSKEEAQAAKSAQAQGGGSSGAPSLGDAGVLSIPLAVVAIGGATVAGKSLDGGFDKFLEDTVIRDSSTDGAGYEEALDAQFGAAKK